MDKSLCESLSKLYQMTPTRQANWLPHRNFVSYIIFSSKNLLSITACSILKLNQMFSMSTLSWQLYISSVITGFYNSINLETMFICSLHLILFGGILSKRRREGFGNHLVSPLNCKEFFVLWHYRWRKIAMNVIKFGIICHWLSRILVGF